MSALFDQPFRAFHELEAWRIKEIKQSIKEAEAGEFASDVDLAIATKKYAG
jgi:predicted transcriptional regulator